METILTQAVGAFQYMMMGNIIRKLMYLYSGHFTSWIVCWTQTLWSWIPWTFRTTRLKTVTSRKISCISSSVLLTISKTSFLRILSFQMQSCRVLRLHRIRIRRYLLKEHLPRSQTCNSHLITNYKIPPIVKGNLHQRTGKMDRIKDWVIRNQRRKRPVT